MRISGVVDGGGPFILHRPALPGRFEHMCKGEIINVSCMRYLFKSDFTLLIHVSKIMTAMGCFLPTPFYWCLDWAINSIFAPHFRGIWALTPIECQQGSYGLSLITCPVANNAAFPGR